MFRYILLPLLLYLQFTTTASAQYTVFAQLKGSPVNLAGWSLSGSAHVGNVLSSDNSEIILATPIFWDEGSIFFNEPINLARCSQWFCEFDMRMYDGTQADGIAFCFLDVPPSDFEPGAGLGIPATANGLKVCFDTWNNCVSGNPFFNMPKIEIRWGVGYDECWSQPTLDNSNGALSFIHSHDYNHVKIEYDKGNIKVSVNDSLYLKGSQTFNFTGYLGFTAATGSYTDMHSIKNVVIYANMPKSYAGQGGSFCEMATKQIGGPATTGYSYQWTPSIGLNDSTLSNPVVNRKNYGTAPLIQKYYVITSFSGIQGCTSKDSVTISIYPTPSVLITTPKTRACEKDTVTFTAVTPNAASDNIFEWQVNGRIVDTGAVFETNQLSDNDRVQCILKPNSPCAPAYSNILTMTVDSAPFFDLGPDLTLCPGNSTTLVAPTEGFASFIWSTGETTPFINAATAGEYSVTGTTIPGCKVSDSLMISIYPKASMLLDHRNYLCQGEQRTLDAGNFSLYKWNTGNTSRSIIVSSVGIYCVAVTDSNGCKTIDSVLITSVIPTPSSFLPADTFICSYSYMDVRSKTAFATYLWNTGERSRSIKAAPGTTYSLQVVDKYGCRGTDSIVVNSKECQVGVYVPSAFTPNDDGRNDVLKPLVFGPVKKFHFLVYNRWGQKVFETTQIDKGWDGKEGVSGNMPAVYVWICEYEFEGEQKKITKGTVTMIR